MRLLEVSSPKSSAVSLDLLNLYVVNQISTKKENTENVRKPVHINITEDEKTSIRRHNLELPMSPPRTQHLGDLQSRLQKQVLKSRRQYLSEKVKYQHNISQVTELAYVDSSTKNEDDIIRAFSASPLPSGFQFSNSTQLSEENFNTNLMGNIWEQTYEKKLQNQPGNSFDQDPWNTKSPSQCTFRKSDTVPQELFELFHRLDHMDSARKNPVLMTSNESENCEGIKEPIFDIVKETAELKGSQDGSGCSFLALFEDESQPIHKNPSPKHFNPLANQSNTDIFFTVSDVRNQMTNRSHSYDTTKAHLKINAKKSSVDRHLEGIFTVPEQVFLKSNNASSASYKEASRLYESHLQNCHEGQHYLILCEKKGKKANLEKIETFAYHHDQWNNLKKNRQNYSRKKGDDKFVKGTAWRQNHLFGFEELATAQEKKFGVSSNLREMEKDVESPLSSQSHSYSPRQTESYLSSSPETSEEDTAKKKEYLNGQSLIHGANLFSASASREAPQSSHTRTVAMQPSSTLAREEANNLQEKDSNIFCATEEGNKPHPALSRGSSHRALKREQVARSTRCDAWSQTERSVTEVEKVDVGTQCGTLRVCSCGGSLPSARSPGGVPAACTAEERPGQEAPQPAGSGSAAGTDAFSSEAEYLSLAGRRTLEVLSYIDKMRERDKP